jgi:hypothetical protein
MQPGSAWYVLIWVAPAEPREDAYFVHDGPFATREAAVTASLEAQDEHGAHRFVRVIASAEAPTGRLWDMADESGVLASPGVTASFHSR